MPATFHFGLEILCDAYVMKRGKHLCNSLIYSHFLCDCYVTNGQFSFDYHLQKQTKRTKLSPQNKFSPRLRFGQDFCSLWEWGAMNPIVLFLLGRARIAAKVTANTNN